MFDVYQANGKVLIDRDTLVRELVIVALEQKADKLIVAQTLLTLASCFKEITPVPSPDTTPTTPTETNIGGKILKLFKDKL